MIRLRRRRRVPDRGAAAVEAALVLPLLLLLVFGIIDFGRMLNAQIKVTEAAREGARASSLAASSAAVQQRVYDVMGGPTDVAVGPGPRCGAGSGSTVDARVTVTYTFEFVTPVAALAGLVGGPKQLTATGVMPCRA